MSKYTPGPWKLNIETETFFCGKNKIIDQNENTVCTLNPHSKTGKDELSESGLANARLIAAAPELLARIKDALGEFRAIEEGHQTDVPQIIEELEFVIAKAEGNE